MSVSGPSDGDNQAYYDAFAPGYERHRGARTNGYHQLIDDLETELVERFGRGQEVLEVGCGTGLILQRIAGFAARAEGVDLSEGMLSFARERGLAVQQASATHLPYPDASFDLACSFKVLAHIPAIRQALSEMTRVVRPGGHVIAEFYNSRSLRALLKRVGPAGVVSPGVRESQVFTRFDSPSEALGYFPGACRLVASRGVRIAVPSAGMMRLPGIGRALGFFERRACDGYLSRYGGFWIAVMRKQ